MSAKKVSPAAGGCWFCQTIDSGRWLFSGEFDCNLHLECLRKEIENDGPPGTVNEELEIFKREFAELLDA